jgi:hypothetical protein
MGAAIRLHQSSEDWNEDEAWRDTYTAVRGMAALSTELFRQVGALGEGAVGVTVCVVVGRLR